MNNKKRLSFLVGVYGFMQLSMIDVGLLSKKGVPLKCKKPLPSEVDAVAIYNWLSDQLKDVGVGKLRSLAVDMDTAVSKLFNDHKVVNNFLLSLLLLRAYVDDSTKMEQILLSGKINRLIDVVDGAVSDEEFDVTIKKTTSRTADNLYRQYIGKPQLTDEVRNAYFKRIVK